MTTLPNRSAINPAVMALADEAASYKRHRAPVVITVPLGSYLRAAAVFTILAIGMMLVWPNPVTLP